MKAQSKIFRTLAVLWMAVFLASAGGAFAQSGRPKVLVLPPNSSLDQKLVRQFQWELAKQLDKSGKFDIVTQDNYDAFLKGMRLDRLPQLPDSLIPMVMDSLQASIHTSGTLSQPGGEGTQVQAEIDYIYVSRQADSKNYTIEGKEVVADNEKKISDLASKSADVIITASDRISAMSIAYSYFRSAIYDKAIENYSKLIAIVPDDVNAHYMMATSYMRMDSTEKAIELYKNILQNLDPNHIPSLEVLAKNYYAQTDYEQAHAHFQRLVEIEPTNYEYVQYTAYSLSRLNRQVEYLDMLNKLVAIRDDSPETRVNIGLAAYKLGSSPPAGTDTTQVIAFWETAIENFQRAADLFQQQEGLDEARKKSMCDCLYYQGISLNKLDRQQQALDGFKKLVELNPEYPNVYPFMANIANEMKKYDEALGYYREALKGATEDQAWRYHYSIGQIYRQQKNDLRNAVEAYSNALKSVPPNIQQGLLLLRGTSYYDLAQELDYSNREEADIDNLIEKGEMTLAKADQAMAHYDRAAADLSKVNDPRYTKSAQQHLENIKQLKVRAEQIKKQVAYYEKTK